MNTEETKSVIRGKKWILYSPTLPETGRPVTLCSYCPLSMWYEQDGMNCYCNHMHFITWGKGARSIHPMLACDARESAVAEELIQANK